MGGFQRRRKFTNHRTAFPHVSCCPTHVWQLKVLKGFGSRGVMMEEKAYCGVFDKAGDEMSGMASLPVTVYSFRLFSLSHSAK
jgi:hypothetical protein